MSDIPRTVVLLVWVAFACSIFFFVFDRSPSSDNASVRPQANAARSQTNNVKEAEDYKFYTGSIVLVEPDRCLVRMMDNRTGAMWEMGYVKCDDFVASLAKFQHRTTSIQRMNSISQAFRSRGE